MLVYVNSILMALLLCVPLILGLYLKQNKKLNTDLTCYLILLTGLVLRIIYISYTDVHTRQHDVHDFFQHNGGHGEYICYLFENHALPDFDPREIWQFYHPPLHHIICAVWLTITKLIGLDPETSGVDSLQFLTVAYSTLLSLFAYKTLRRFDLKPNTLAMCTAIVTFYPTLIILSGSLNNDILSALFGMMSIYYTVKWSQDKKWYSIIMIALSVGLGMFTKLTVGLLAPAIATVFLFVLIKCRKEWKRLVPQFVVFGVICIPIGLFWSVRNFVKFDMPLNYVPKISEDSGQFIDVPAVKRYVDFSLYQISSPFTQWEWSGAKYNEFNPIIALLKNAMFDEQTFFTRSITLQSFCTSLFFVNIILVGFTVFALFFMWFRNKNFKLEYKLFITIIATIIFGNYMVFCKNYPHVCTQNMRYCVPLIFVEAVLLGLFTDGAENSESKFYKKSVTILKKCSAVFCLLSIFVYTAMMFYEI